MLNAHSLGQGVVTRRAHLLSVCTSPSLIMCDLVTGPLQALALMHAGTNAAYVERISNIPSMGQPDAPAEAETVVNTEWGAFSCAAIPRCAADAALDADSVRPGAQPFEKLVSGMYLPEIVRRCVATRRCALLCLFFIGVEWLHRPRSRPRHHACTA